MLNFAGRGIRFKLSLINAIFVLLLSGLLTLIFLGYAKREFLDDIRKDARTLTAHLAHNSALPLLSRNRDLIDRDMEGLLNDPDVVYCAVYYRDGELLVKKSREGYKSEVAFDPAKGMEANTAVREYDAGSYSVIEARAPVLLDKTERGREEIGFADDLFSPKEAGKELVGFAVVGLSTERLNQKYTRLFTETIFVYLLLSLMGIGGIIFLLGRFVAPLLSLSSAARRVAEGNLDVEIDANSGDEVGTLAEAFQYMLDSLKEHISEIKESQREIEAIFDGITDYIWVVDPDCTMVRANRIFAEKVGMSVKEIVGKSCRDIVFLGESLCRTACPMQGVGVAAGLRSDAADFMDKESGRIYQMMTFPLLTSDNVFRGGINYLKDISETKMMEKHLIQSEKLAATGRMAADVAHEVNNPLGIIKNYLTMLKREIKGNAPEVIESLDVIDEEISRIAVIIKGLLAFSRPEYKDEGFVDINRTIESIVTLVGNSMKKHGVELDMKLDRSIPEIKISSGHLKQVMINLINNSLDAMPEGGELFVSTYDRKDGAVIAVEDSGSGIRQEDIKELFTPFYTTKGVKGTGLGLAISYGLVKGYGGDINLRAKEEKGVVASVFLPYKN